MIVPESTKIKQKRAWSKDFEERIQSRRSGPFIQLHTKTLSRKA